MDSQRSHGTAAASPASSDLSSANEDEAVSPVRSPTAVSRARKRRKVYPWPEEEAELYDELVASYGKGEKIDWQAVADELARKCSLAPAPARTAKACEGRVYNLKVSQGKGPATPHWSQASNQQLQRGIRQAEQRAGSLRAIPLSTWESIAAGLNPPRTAGACKIHYNKVLTKSTPNGSTSPRPLPTSTTPDAVITSHLVSAAEQPFSVEDDELLLESYRAQGPLYKKISRLMDPQRHKVDVRERVEYLLQPYEF